MKVHTLEHGDVRLRAFQEEGVVLKTEHWSETHVSGYIDAPQVYSGVGGTVHSSGGGGSISSRVENWSRLFVDVGNGQERAVRTPGSFPVREGHRLVMRYVDAGRGAQLLKVENANTGSWFTTGYDGSDVIGNAWLRRVFLVLGLLPAGLFALARMDGMFDVHLYEGSEFIEPLLQLIITFAPLALVLALQSLLTRRFTMREKAVRGFLEQARI